MALPQYLFLAKFLHLQYILGIVCAGLGLAYFLGSTVDGSVDTNSAKFYSVKIYLYCDPENVFIPGLNNIKTYDEVNIFVVTKYAC